MKALCCSLGASRGLIAAVALVIAALPAQAATWYAANNGLDDNPCTKTAPCRSITKTMSVAAEGNTIEVGPGIYGDINGSGTVGDYDGEEIPSSGCMVNITSRVTLVSKDGAGSTVLDAGGDALAVVCISAGASGAVFGKPNKGFTLRNGQYGLGVYDPTTGVQVQGNVASNNAYQGFEISATGTVLKGNIATDNVYHGFDIVVPGLVLTGNLARNNGAAGFAVHPSSGGVVTKNIAVANLGGFGIFPDPTGTPITFTQNTALGNGHWGVYVIGTDLTGPATVTILKNNIFGNGEEGFGGPPPTTNCGLTTDNGTNPLTVNATNNFWGGATGPGGNPADAAGGACDTDAGGGITLRTAPFATKQFKLSPPKIK